MLLRFFDLIEDMHPAASFSGIFSTAKERMTASKTLETLLRNAYQIPHPLATYKRLNITTKQLLQTTESQKVCNLTALTKWPDYILEALQQDGETVEGILLSGKFPLEVHIVDQQPHSRVEQQHSIVYWLPQDRDLLFPPCDVPAPDAFKRKTELEAFDNDIYCKYLLKSKCHHCGASPAPGSKLQACSGCKTASYCGRSCQAADWPEHKTVCKMLSRLTSPAI